MSILQKIVETKKQEVAACYAAGQDTVFQTTGFPNGSSLYTALQTPKLSLIAELKKASPSKGVLRPNFDPLSLAHHYSHAAALSVLTDRSYFMGDPIYLATVRHHSETGQLQKNIPLLRKDFIIDPIQIYEAKFLGASAVLLIKAILNDTQALSLIRTAQTCGLDVLFEVHTDEELAWALSQTDIRILGINARNLATFDTDIPAQIHRLTEAKKVRPDCLLVAESGIKTTDLLETYTRVGIAGVLIGEGLNSSLLEWFK